MTSPALDTPPPRTTTATSSSVAVVAIPAARARIPWSITRSAISSPARASAVSARASSPPVQPCSLAAATRAGPRAYISVQPWPPQTHFGPQALTLMWPRWTELPVTPVNSLLSITAPPPTPVDSTMPIIEVDVAAGAEPVLAEGEAVPVAGQPDADRVRSVRLGDHVALPGPRSGSPARRRC